MLFPLRLYPLRRRATCRLVCGNEVRAVAARLDSCRRAPPQEPRQARQERGVLPRQPLPIRFLGAVGVQRRPLAPASLAVTPLLPTVPPLEVHGDRRVTTCRHSRTGSGREEG